MLETSQSAEKGMRSRLTAHGRIPPIEIRTLKCEQLQPVRAIDILSPRLYDDGHRHK